MADAVVGEGAGEVIAAATEKAPDLESTFRQIRMDSFGNDLISPEIRKTFTENMTQEEFAAAKQSTVEKQR